MIRLLILSLFVFFSPSYAQKHEKGFHIKEKALYLTQEQIKEIDLEPPPKEGEKKDIEELNTLKKIQSQRTKEECEKAVAQKYANFEDFFGQENPFPSPMPKKVKKFFKTVKEDTDVAVSYYKNLYAKPRPFDRDKEIQTCFGQKAGGYAYPSGHAAISAVYALILSDLLPEKKEVFMKLAEQASANRVIWGVHHPSDVEAGKKIAYKIYSYFLLNKDFVKKRDKLKKYIISNNNK
ncbi:MAG: phosphatase PAP2 family protein [Elusimicrobia bacterium]|nr:phosphatase PAP2 family protein [Elusimicrobiota bacterium]